MTVIKAERNLANRLYMLRNVYHQFFERHALFALGSSATTANSGIAFTVSFYKKHIQPLNAMAVGITGSLRAKLIKQGYQIAFAETALLFAEKESDFEQKQMLLLQNRNAWSKQVWSKAQLLCKGIVSFKRNPFLSGLTLLQLPLFTTLFLAIFFLLVNVYANSLLALYWMIGLLLFSISILSIYYWQQSKSKPSSTGSSVLTQLQSLYEETEVKMYSTAESF